MAGLLASARARILRKRQPVYDGGVSTLRRFQDDVKEVRSGLECGIKLGDFSEYQVGDVIECISARANRPEIVTLVIPSEVEESRCKTEI